MPKTPTHLQVYSLACYTFNENGPSRYGHNYSNISTLSEEDIYSRQYLKEYCILAKAESIIGLIPQYVPDTMASLLGGNQMSQSTFPMHPKL